MCKKTPRQMVKAVKDARTKLADIPRNGSLGSILEQALCETELYKATLALEGFIRDTFGTDSFGLREVISDAENSL